MKSLKTMHSLALARAVAIGPRPDPNRHKFGYYLTISEIRNLYSENGFNVSPKRTLLGSHLNQWEYVGWIRIGGDLGIETTPIWFPIPVGTTTSCMIEAERAGFDKDAVVDVVE